MNDSPKFGFRELVLVLLLIVALLLFFVSYKMGQASMIGKMINDHFKAVIALPFAAIGALILVFAAHKINASSKVHFWGIKFEGAASMVISWILVFITLSVAIANLW